MKNLKYIAPAIDVLALNTEGMIAESPTQVTQMNGLENTPTSGGVGSGKSGDGKEGSYSVWDE